MCGWEETSMEVGLASEAPFLLGALAYFRGAAESSISESLRWQKLYPEASRWASPDDSHSLGLGPEKQGETQHEFLSSALQLGQGDLRVLMSLAKAVSILPGGSPKVQMSTINFANAMFGTQLKIFRNTRTLDNMTRKQQKQLKYPQGL